MLYLILDKMGRKGPAVTENLFSFDSEKAALHLTLLRTYLSSLVLTSAL